MIKDELILIDWDSTIIQTGLSVINTWNYLHSDRKLIYNEPLEWDFSNVLNGTDITLSELFTCFDSKEFYKDGNVVLINGVVQVINRLIDKGYNIKVLSKHEESRKSLTREYVEYLFNGKVKIEFVDNFDDKISYEAFCIIDDKVECLEKSKSKYQICFGDYQWNKDYMGIKTYDWNEVESLIKYFEECEECF